MRPPQNALRRSFGSGRGRPFLWSFAQRSRFQARSRRRSLAAAREENSSTRILIPFESSREICFITEAQDELIFRRKIAEKRGVEQQGVIAIVIDVFSLERH